MLSNRVKRNIWLTLAIVSLSGVVSRTIQVIDGTVSWRRLAISVLVTAFSAKCYFSYRREVKAGNLFGPVNPF